MENFTIYITLFEGATDSCRDAYMHSLFTVFLSFYPSELNFFIQPSLSLYTQTWAK